MVRNGSSQPTGKFGVFRMKRQILRHRSGEIFHIFGLNLFTAFCVSHLSLRKTFGGTLRDQFLLNLLNRCS